MRFDRRLPRKQLLVLAVTIHALAAGASPHARAEPPAQPPPAADDVTNYSFDDDQVLGDTVGPLGEVLHVRKRPNRESLIRARDQFIRELLMSVEAL